MNATTAISAAQREEIEQSIADLEQRSSVNVICALATESGRYERAEAIVGLVVALLVLSLANALHASITTSPGEWATTGLPLGWQAVAVALGFVAGHALAMYVRPVRKLFIGEGRMQRQVERSASHVFATHTPGDTAMSGGVLIYISLFERRIVIRVGEDVQAALGTEQINHLRDMAVDHLKRGEFGETFAHLIAEIEPLLTEKLPADGQRNAVNVPDHLLRFHPRPISGV